MWTCPTCGAVNNDQTSGCVACSATRCDTASDVVVAEVVPDSEQRQRWDAWAAQRRVEPQPISRLGEGGSGVPRRFSIGRMMLLVTFFALVFGIMQWLGANKYLFAAFTLLIAGVGAAQPLLFGGRNPRLASVIAGVIVSPVVFAGTMAVAVLAEGGRLANELGPMVAGAVIVGLIFGPFLGYFAGCLIASVFLNSEEEEDTDSVSDVGEAS